MSVSSRDLFSANAISGVNGYNLQVILIVGCRVGVSAVVVAESWLLPHRDISRKPWRDTVCIEVSENSSAIFARVLIINYTATQKKNVKTHGPDHIYLMFLRSLIPNPWSI